MKTYSKYIKFGCITLIIGLTCFIAYSKLTKDKTHNGNFEIYTPAEEISDEQIRQTTISLFFIDKDNGNIVKIDKSIDSKLLVKEPAITVLQDLIIGPDTLLNNCISYIPKTTKINSIKVENEIAIIDFSEEYINDFVGTKEDEEKAINCILDTLTQFNEINGITFLIDGKENCTSKTGISLNRNFIKMD